ncbi:hypothetical protein M5W83_27095 [Paenibacillus thiaminolyticus]|uniref:Uncharacterized protein n=1 Tax=Paenibacillus thiaminolyticus TaxID=49283 RepID=A0AAP9DX84_PANTH|nr:hypothetical protein [Paenibacillus thiaminolyticus]MCY9538397.1 hypothetical protein [Paenibacillus thiaminolyticus]MCY9602696.1 hypothetical protein [Paenibacillus thiaminolyticus]MCY9610816.1 hypothetical protein [Paenibacillus thiaminolyticus]MCY9616587.1 hypothetical protein [Paenibacillus thiaminolyticus]MCY9621413.1 hypothetical protein [Paenibacillus thiaminolyticus]
MKLTAPTRSNPSPEMCANRNGFWVTPALFQEDVDAAVLVHRLLHVGFHLVCPAHVGLNGDAVPAFVSIAMLRCLFFPLEDGRSTSRLNSFAQTGEGTANKNRLQTFRNLWYDIPRSLQSHFAPIVVQARR